MQTTTEEAELFSFNSVGLLTCLLCSGPKRYSFPQPGTRMLRTSPLHPQDALSEWVQGEKAKRSEVSPQPVQLSATVLNKKIFSQYSLVLHLDWEQGSRPAESYLWMKGLWSFPRGQGSCKCENSRELAYLLPMQGTKFVICVWTIYNFLTLTSFITDRLLQLLMDKSSGLFNAIKGWAIHLVSQITSSTVQARACCSTVVLFIVIHDITLKKQWCSLPCKQSYWLERDVPCTAIYL